MRPSPSNAQGVAKLLAKALPFEKAWPRYALCAWLLLGAGAASWALLVAQPATANLLARAGHLVDLERNHSLALASDGADIDSLRALAAEARSRLHPDPQALDLAIVAVVEKIQALGWNAILASVERDDASNPRLAFATYQLELKKAAVAEASAPTTLNAELLAILQSIAERDAKIDVQRLEILSEDARFAKAFLTLAAATAK